MKGYGVPNTSTMSLGDLYQGSSSYAATPVQTQTNPKDGGASVSNAAAQTKTPAGAASGLQLPGLIALAVCAIVLVRYY